VSTDKLLFMPFDTRSIGTIGPALREYGATGQGAQQKNQLTIDHDLAKGKVAVEVWYNGKKNTFVQGMTTGQIYIRGHGMAGENIIEGGRGGEKLRYDDVVDRLIKSGLSKAFTGKIKCYNCHSAESIDPTGLISASIVETGGAAFAQLIADEMYHRGYRSCTFYGYEGAIDSLPKDGSQGTHKYRRGLVKGLDGKSRQQEMGRVSENRFEFTPNPRPKPPSFGKVLKGLFAKKR
jgi:hypothetical protein